MSTSQKSSKPNKHDQVLVEQIATINKEIKLIHTEIEIKKQDIEEIKKQNEAPKQMLKR